MTRTTVYRYFPSQESMLLELSVTVSIDEIDDVLAQTADGTTICRRGSESRNDRQRKADRRK